MSGDIAPEAIGDRYQRFAAVDRLYGNRESAWIRELHVCVVGVGGVGSWAAEALARSGVGPHYAH